MKIKKGTAGALRSCLWEASLFLPVTGVKSIVLLGEHVKNNAALLPGQLATSTTEEEKLAASFGERN